MEDLASDLELIPLEYSLPHNLLGAVDSPTSTSNPLGFFEHWSQNASEISIILALTLVSTLGVLILSRLSRLCKGRMKASYRNHDKVP